MKGGKKLSKRGIIPKPEMNDHILIYVTTLLLIIHDLNSAMAVLFRLYRIKGGTNHVSLDIYPGMKKKVVFSPSHFFLDN